VQPAIKDAATSAQKSVDWVLETTAKDDLTLEGSPEQIQKTLVEMYKRDYAEAWRQFVQGISVASFELPRGRRRDEPPRRRPGLAGGQADQGHRRADGLGQPGLANVGLERAQRGFFDWVKQSVLQMAPSPVKVDVNVTAKPVEIPLGPIGREFAGFGRLALPREGGEPLLDTYLKQLSKIRTRLNGLQNQGDPGPGAVKLMRETLDGGASELAEGLRFVDEQMLTGMPDAQRAVLRPLLLRPLLQSYAAVIKPASEELNKTWEAQVYEPFNRKLAIKYPFAPKSGIEASPAEIAQMFGPEGAIAKYVDGAMGPLVVRRGNTVTPRTWGELGLVLQPEFGNGFARWVSPLEGGAAADAGGSAGQAQTVFMLRPQPAEGTTGFVVEIDGQKLAYRNGPTQWNNFVWPNAAGAPGARIVATTFDGRTVEVINVPGRFGLEKMINAARRTRQPDGSFRLVWASEGVEVGVDLRIVSSTQVQAAAPAGQGGGAARGLGGLVLPARAVAVGAGHRATCRPVPRRRRRPRCRSPSSRRGRAMSRGATHPRPSSARSPAAATSSRAPASTR
jgi:type VI secretion system protein ImpL